MEVKVINKSHHPLPHYATEHSAGLDLRANIESPIVLEPLERVLIPTGLYIELPPGTEAQIRPRSGLAYKQGLTVMNSPGTIDADYRGEVGVLLVNVSNEKQTIEDGERVAQMVIAEYLRIEWNEQAELGSSERGAGGFGSTGKS